MKMSSLTLAIVLSLAIGGGAISTPANATGIPVIDIANLQQQITHYLNMIQQLKQLQSQLQQAKDQYKSITGSRGLGNILQENYTANVPANWQETLSAMQGGGKVGQLAKQISSAASQLKSQNFEGVAKNVVDSLSSNMESKATAQALNAEVYDGSGDRFTRIQSLADQINTAPDLKAINDLQARLQAENLSLQNEAVKLQSMNAMIAAQNDVKESAAIEDGIAKRHSATY